MSTSEVLKKATLARAASRELARLTSAQKDRLLAAMADELIASTTKIMLANKKDLSAGKKSGLSAALLDRLELTPVRIKNMADALRELLNLPDPVGKVLAQFERPNGLKITKISVPMGVIGIIYEARPNVTVDAAALCLKAGSAVILRGGSAAAQSNRALVKILRQVISQQNFSPEMIQLIESPDRALVKQLITLKEYIDLIIPRGGAQLIDNITQNSTIPVIETGTGNCHLYVDQSANLEKAARIAYNAKVQRPSVCNSIETLLVHEAVASRFLPGMIRQYQEANVIIHGCPITKKYGTKILTATKKDYATEYLDLEIAIRVVKSLDEALEHIRLYSSRHTEAIVTEDTQAIAKFLQEVDAAAVIANASTRFTDGGEFGFGCELGISTQKLHARGPFGLPEITSYKYLVEGSGQVRT